tara:strand:- start:365 stop:673 length:309 start_codon:yes stop_codon:yes gene_type:complete
LNYIYLNATILPLLAMMFISDAIRDKNTGAYLGFLNLKIALYFAGVLAVEIYFFVSDFGVSLTTVGRVIGVSLMPFIAAFVFVKYSHKERFGVEFNRKKKNE